ncbi:MAG: acetyl-CoA carboxylase biotin carboxyl carrier protein [Helicobacteraceae bacterium]|nr:acetyl-CoA carboxylase biotin carboxyl carrier protein [Helicobacteraceae bacterium]
MLNLDEIRSLADYLDNSSLSKIKIKQDGFSVELERRVFAPPIAPSAAASISPPPIAPSAAAPISPPPVAAQPSAVKGDVISSPMVGAFYRSPSPDAPPFANAGDRVAKGAPLCVLEAMKMFNEIEAEYDCTILEILVEDGQVVEYDTPLFIVKRN